MQFGKQSFKNQKHYYLEIAMSEPERIGKIIEGKVIAILIPPEEGKKIGNKSKSQNNA